MKDNKESLFKLLSFGTICCAVKENQLTEWILEETRPFHVVFLLLKSAQNKQLRPHSNGDRCYKNTAMENVLWMAHFWINGNSGEMSGY